MSRVVVTGLGIVSPLGIGISTVWKNLIASKSGIKKLPVDDANSPFSKSPISVAGQVTDWDPAIYLDKDISIRRIPLFAQYALAASKQALDDSKWQANTPDQLESTGVCIGSGIGGFEDIVENVTKFNAGGHRKVSPLFIPRLLNNMAAGNVSIHYGFQGPNVSPSSACTTGAHAIGDATRLIRDSSASVMVAGSAEATLHPLAFSGFARAKSLSTTSDPEAASRPFDRSRNGFVMGEGSGIMILEDLEHAKARGAKIYAEVVGYGLSGDAHHITAPPENGAGAYRAMKMAIKQAGIDPKEVGYVNAHATSTKIGDKAESAAIEKLFGTDVRVSSTKGAIGHLLGASGSVEAIFTVMALHTGELPPTLNLNLNDLEEGLNLNYVGQQSEKVTGLKYALTNSFGFGGTNASILFKKYSD